MHTAPPFHAGGTGSKLDEEKTFLFKCLKHHLFLAFEIIQILPYPVIR